MKRKIGINLLFVSLLVGLLWAQSDAIACTGIMLRPEDGSVVSGRTLEFGTFVDTSVVIVPRGYKFIGQTPGGEGLKYAAKYAAISLCSL